MSDNEETDPEKAEADGPEEAEPAEEAESEKADGVEESDETEETEGADDAEESDETEEAEDAEEPDEDNDAEEDDDDAEEAEEAEPPVTLGEGPDVSGEPIARVASRLTWPAKRSEVRTQEGDAVIRTPDGTRDLDDVLADSDVPLFESRSDFVTAVEEQAGRGPVATE